ncbi:hypothetical protein BpOF4_06060 [Alkalihalophilus pseudofirmus OF4]|uniref:Uncharacterized protein n=1 Tax=Alkalihalophilus pseudofirmus (strain ATCC BAA-2126 / JCM 17055 / OF4) TaxID=398511 RepID=D3FZN2_ALKPO|nr:hypothetical protein BpOF4_06060 [Alkalihalophilus pseudofirmus OF4]
MLLLKTNLRDAGVVSEGNVEWMKNLEVMSEVA